MTAKLQLLEFQVCNKAVISNMHLLFMQKYFCSFFCNKTLINTLYYFYYYYDVYRRKLWRAMIMHILKGHIKDVSEAGSKIELFNLCCNESEINAKYFL